MSELNPKCPLCRSEMKQIWGDTCFRCDEMGCELYANQLEPEAIEALNRRAPSAEQDKYAAWQAEEHAQYLEAGGPAEQERARAVRAKMAAPAAEQLVPTAIELQRFADCVPEAALMPHEPTKSERDYTEGYNACRQAMLYACAHKYRQQQQQQTPEEIFEAYCEGYYAGVSKDVWYADHDDRGELLPNASVRIRFNVNQLNKRKQIKPEHQDPLNKNDDQRRLINSIRQYAGKQRNQVTNANITARETIAIADYIVALESRVNTHQQPQERNVIIKGDEYLVRFLSDHDCEIRWLRAVETHQQPQAPGEPMGVDEFNSIHGPTFMGEPVLTPKEKPAKEFVEDDAGYFLYGDMAIRYLRNKLEQPRAAVPDGLQQFAERFAERNIEATGEWRAAFEDSWNELQDMLAAAPAQPGNAQGGEG